MEAPEDVMGSYSSSSTGTGPTVLKRKRSKRPAPPPPAPPVGAASSSSTPSADYLSSATEEEEDMAHCLILLARGRALADSSPPPPPADKFTSRRFTETTTTAGGKAGFYVYECKTCNKCFPSFQALGGHRASHKKPKMAAIPTAAEDKNLIMNYNTLEDGLDISTVNAFSKPPATLNVSAANSPTNNNNNNNKMRVHECSICGAEFSSGQALGGHMRRHRPIGAAPSSPTQEVVTVKKERNIVLSLDLNLPAPSDENPQPPPPPPPPPVSPAAFSFADKRPMVFSATSAAALVDCHY